MATLRQVAVLARVSTATVSHVLNGNYKVSPKLRARVMKVIKDLNYQPNDFARSLKTNRSKTIGMVVTDMTNPFYGAAVRGAEDVLAREGYTLVIGNSGEDYAKEESYYKTFKAKRAEGLIIVTCPTLYPPSYLLRHMMEEMPVVTLNRDYPGLQADTVVADNLEGSYQAVRHLIEAGHRRIGIITGQRNNIASARRLQGYERALTEHQLKCEEELLQEGHFSDPGTGYNAAMKLLTMKKPPSALFIFNVRMTMGALKAIHELGMKIPAELALVSFDDEEWFESVRPRISGVAQPAYDLGVRAAEIVMDRIKGKLPKSPCRKVLKTELKVRESSNMQFSGHGNEVRLPEVFNGALADSKL
jgi:LacI family transcriptional regulator